MTSDGIQSFKNRFPFVWNLLTTGFLIIQSSRLKTVMLNIMTFQGFAQTGANPLNPITAYDSLKLTF